MDKQYSWKRTEDTEIDLADLLRRLCKKWKQAVVCALVSSVILGGYGWMRGSNSPDAAMPDLAEESGLTEEEIQGVASAVQLKNETDSLEEYLDGSVLMQIDPYHREKVIMLYCIDNAKRQELPKITESYLNYLVNGGAVDALIKSGSRMWKMDKSCLAELVTAYQKTYSSPYQVVVEEAADSSILSESLFYVEITGKNIETAEQMAEEMQAVLKKYSAKVTKIAGGHKLALVNSAESVTADSVLQTQQRDKRALLTSNKTSLKAMTDVFTKEQMAAYRGETGMESDEDESQTDIDMNSLNLSLSIKYAVLGLAAGIFVYCGIFSCVYLLRDTVKSTEEMKRLYLFPFYGGIMLKDRSGRQHTGRRGAKPDDCERSKVQMMNRIRLACKKQGVERLYAASDFLYDGQEKDCLESIARQLKDWGIDMKVADDVSLNASVWDDLTETGNVLIMCRIGTTTHRMIDHAMNFYQENGIAVLGAAAFLENV